MDSRLPTPGDEPDLDRGPERAHMVDKQLRARGIQDERVLGAMGHVPREHFLPPRRRRDAYRDRAVPLSGGQTMSQPYMVAVMTEALRPALEHRILEVGTGSGYQAAVLALLVNDVLSIERIPELAAEARRRLDDLGLVNVRVRTGDGTLGWPEEAPFHGIVVTAAAPGVPARLKAQLDPRGGRLVLPVGDRSLQQLTVVERDGDTYRQTELLACRFVPLLGEDGW